MSWFITGVLAGLVPAGILAAAVWEGTSHLRCGAACDTCGQPADYQVGDELVCADCYAGWW